MTTDIASGPPSSPTGPERPVTPPIGVAAHSTRSRGRDHSGWRDFLVRRTLRLVTLVAAVAIAAFSLMAASPVDPVQAYVGADIASLGPEQRALIEQTWGFNDPPLERFGAWLNAVLHGNLGQSIVFNQPVASVIGERFMTSLALMLAAWLLSGVLGFAMGIAAGMFRGRLLDKALTWWAFTLASAPTFWVGLLLLYVFAVNLNVAPVCCAVPVGTLANDVTILDRLHHLMLPALTLSIIGVAPILLHTRQAVVEALDSDHIAFARAQGERGWGLVRHRVVRSAAGPALMLSFASFGELFGGSILAEQVYAYPGLGSATTQAALRQDVPLLLGIAVFTTVFVFVGNLLGDVAHHLVDRRVPLGGAR